MTAMFLKELRENAKWGLVIFGVMLVKVYLQVRDPSPLLLFQMPQATTMWLAPLAGLLMGVVQVLFETKPDNWAFVVHRPVPRLHVFYAKCAAGLLLLYAALGVPVLLAAAWAARPGNLAMPFQVRMVLPPLADAFGAGAYYFVGMLVTLRRARWHGTRLLPLGLAVAASTFAYFLTAEFWQAMMIELAAMSVGAAAAWGVFAGSGDPDAGSSPSRLALAAMVYPGALALGVFAVGLTQTVLFDSAGREWRYYQVDPSGAPVLVTQRLVREERSWSVTDPAGRPLPKYEGVDLDDPASANVFLRFSPPLLDEDTVIWPFNALYLSTGYRSPAPGVVPLRAAAPPGVRLPFAPIYNVPERVIDLYDPVTHAPLGTVGPGGFAPRHAPPLGQFPGTPLNLMFRGNSHVLAFDSAAYWLTLDRRQVRLIFTPPEGDPIVSAVEVGPAADPSVVVATRHHLHLFRPDGRAVFAAPMEFDTTHHVYHAALVPGSGHLVLQPVIKPDNDTTSGRLLEFATDGSLAALTDLPRLPPYGGPRRVETAFFGLLFPVALRPLFPPWLLDDLVNSNTEANPRLFHGMMVASALLCAAATVLIARRCGLGAGRTAGWAAAGALLGPAAVVAMLGLTAWPPREECVACGGRRLVGRRACGRCGAGLPPPALDGREIFEPAFAVSS